MVCITKNSGCLIPADVQFIRMIERDLEKFNIVSGETMDNHEEIASSLPGTPLLGGSFLSCSIDAKIRLLEDHRKDAFIVCPASCWCWELEKEILEQEMKE